MKIQLFRRIAMMGVLILSSLTPGVIMAAVCLAPPSGMVGWWPGDGNAKDLIAHHDGIYLGGYIAGEVDQAFAINGGNNAVTIANDPSLEPASVTVDAWVKSTQPNDFKWIVAKGASNCDSASYGLYTNGNNPDDIRFIVYDGSTFGVAVAQVSGMWNNTWHHVAGSFGLSTVKLYVDGNLVQSVPYASSILYGLPTNNDLTIGRYVGCPPSSNNFAFTGSIDEVEIFNRVLSDQEINSIYTAGAAGKCKFIKVTIDVKSQLQHNCLQVLPKGVTPVVISGSATFSVSDVNVSSLRLNGLSVAIRGKNPLCHISDSLIVGGFPYMVCQFDNSSASWDTSATTAVLTGTLNDGTAIRGEDTICN